MTSSPTFRYGTAEPGSDPFDVRVRTRGTAGGRFRADRLAPWFTVPALTRDLVPASPWTGVEVVRPTPPRPAGTSDPAEFADRFRAAVAGQMRGHEVVGIAVSGGLDSAAILDAAGRQARADGQRLVVVTHDIADDSGRRTVPLVAGLLEFLGVDAELVSIDPRPSRWPEPAWVQAGPRFDAWPRVHTGMVLACQERGAGVLLQGSGSDELLGTPRHLTGDLLHPRHWATLSSYRKDTPTPGGVVADLLSATGRIKGPRRARLYWATCWPGLAEVGTAPVLAPEREAAALSWLASFQEESLRLTVELAPTWPEAVLLHAVFPYDTLPPAGDLPEALPFLDPDFARYAYHLPLRDRFVPGEPSAYLRGKGLVTSVLPIGIDRMLAPKRQRCYKAYRRYWQTVATEAPLAVRLGVLRPDWRRHCRDAFDLAMAVEADRWLEGAIAHGGVPEEDGEPADDVVAAVTG